LARSLALVGAGEGGELGGPSSLRQEDRPGCGILEFGLGPRNFEAPLGDGIGAVDTIVSLAHAHDQGAAGPVRGGVGRVV